MKEKIFLNFYKECVKEGKMPTQGMCKSFVRTEGEPILDLFEPTFVECLESGHLGGHWGALEKNYNNSFKRYYEFNEFRQTVILFCAAINDEL